MRKLVVAVIVLLALFSLIRAYSETAAGTEALSGVRVHPGLVEVGDGNASLGISFGIMDRTGAQGRFLNFLPLHVVFQNGEKTVSLGLNGIEFLLGSGASIGAPVVVTGVRHDDVVSVGGEVTVDGRVEGDVWAVGAGIRLTPRAAVTGNVVAIGGTVTSAPGAVVSGSTSQLPGLKIPFLGVLGTGFSAQALGLAGTALGYILCGFALFISTYFFSSHAQGLLDAMPSLWRQSLITLAVSLVVVPLATLLLVASVAGIFLLPLAALLLFILSLDGFLVLCVRVGAWVRGGPERATDRSLWLFTTGLLALFLLNVPALVGIFLTAFRSGLAARIGTALQTVGAGITAAGFLYGFGASLAFARSRAVKQHGT